MKLSYLRMYPFAGASDRMVTFADGINVLHGNNEAGKSTICKAIHHTLYTRSQLSKPEFRKKMERFIPVGKGDTARTELGFEHGGAHYRLCRSWGASRQSELWLPDGSCITNEDAIQAQVESFLGMKEGTFSALYYIDQEGLQAKLDAMKKDEDTMQTMGDFFMRLSMGAGGVSIQAFTDLVDAEIARTYSRWDTQFNMPQNGRGIDNPYKKEVGFILEHFYALEGARRDHTLAQEAEKAIDAVNDKIRTLETRLSETTAYLDEKRDLYQRCVELESRRSSIAAARAKAETLRSVLKRWDEVDLFFVGCPSSEGALQKRAEDIESERTNRTSYDALRKKVEAIMSVRALMKERTDAAAALASGRYVSNADYDLYAQAHTRLATNRAVMESQKSAVTIHSNEDATLGIRCDRGDAETLVIE
ncbi:MAG: AAA family ATPase, partial [Candidatus Methanofastidiosa archaeon]|nr:AAA family ATPase [Candidatus Methanofastidiosa archaeon]